MYVHRDATAEEDDQQDAEEIAGGDGSGDSDENLAKIAANVSDNLCDKSEALIDEIGRKTNADSDFWKQFFDRLHLVVNATPENYNVLVFHQTKIGIITDQPMI